MKTQEAITKWCPFVRVVAIGETIIFNRAYTSYIPGIKEVDYTCITSDCMAWEESPIDGNDGCCKLINK